VTTKATYKVMLDKMGGTQVTEYIGLPGEVFWNPEVGSLRLSDGVTVGGLVIPITGAALGVRQTTAPVTASSVADGVRAEIDITGHKSYNLYSITADKACWVRLYDSAASRTADASRTQGTDPAPNAGVVAEAIFTGNGGTINFTPGVIGYNFQDPVTSNVAVAVVNNHGSTQNIDISLTILQLEG
jgi:hypothetical protein